MGRTELRGRYMNMVREITKEGVAHLHRALLDYQKYDPPTFGVHVSVLDHSCGDSD